MIRNCSSNADYQVCLRSKKESIGSSVFTLHGVLSFLFLFLQGGCYDSIGQSERRQQKPDSETIDLIGLTDGTDSVANTRTLDKLSPDESREVCVAALGKIDLCASRGYKENTEESCRQYVEACRSKNGDFDLYASCKTMDYGEPGTCPVTPSEYFSCIEAFEQIRNCENLGKDLVAPKTCWKVIDQCGLLADEFGRKPEQVPQCSDTSAPGDPVHDKDIYGALGCFPKPGRFVVLGDSISKCVSFSEKIEDCNCSWKHIAGYIRNNYAPDLSIEGCYPYDEIRGTIKDVASDIQTIRGGSGHIAIWISAIAWDLMDLGESVEEAVPGWLDDWQRVFEYFGDRSRFPDGATFMLNSIYNPTDACPDSEKNTTYSNLSLAEDYNIRYAIENVLVYFAQERDDTITVDIYPDWLGHGYNFDVANCPYYSSEKEYWMSDLLHPNNTGYLYIAEKWKRAIDRIYGKDCQGRAQE
ncbi:MAG: hypothetical protein JXA30_12255 [Deltaproteobacteria bacterium]|nr:hypothetical protein [Deltaproteobacteria bacterium]